MVKLEFNVENQYITMPVRRTVVADSVEYLEAIFVFSEDWANCRKTVIFKEWGNEYAVLLEKDCCMIPCEVIKEGCFSVSVFGIDGNTRITTNEVYVTVQKSGYTEGETPKGPTPDAYSQLLNDMETEITERKAYDEELTNQLSGKVDKIEGKGLSSNDYTDADVDLLTETYRNSIKENESYATSYNNEYYSFYWHDVLSAVAQFKGMIEGQDFLLYADKLFPNENGEYKANWELLESVPFKADKDYVDEQIGSIETALDEIIAIQNTLMGDAEGDTVSSGEIANEL